MNIEVSRRHFMQLAGAGAAGSAMGALGFAEAEAQVAELIAPDLGWDADEQAHQVDAYRASIEEERAAPQLPETALDAALGA